MDVSVFQVFGSRIASNPHARNRSFYPLLPPSHGPRRARRALRSFARRALPNA